MQENKEVLELLKSTIEKADYTEKLLPFFFTFYLAHDSTFHTIDMTYLRQVAIGMNVAASEFYGEKKDKTYDPMFMEDLRF
jgi:enolase